MHCAKCGRELSDVASVVRKHGPSCWRSHVAELSEHERFAASMTGYKVKRVSDAVFIVTSPKADSYVVQLSPAVTCDCPAFVRNDSDCKHVRWLLHTLNEERPRKTDAEIEEMMLSDFPS